MICRVKYGSHDPFLPQIVGVQADANLDLERWQRRRRREVVAEAVRVMACGRLAPSVVVMSDVKARVGGFGGDSSLVAIEEV
jgi:hypothetical protein